MRHQLLTAALVAMAMTWAAAAVTRAAEDEDEDRDDGETQLNLDQVPEAVRKALVKEAGGAKFDSVEREVEDGKTVYEIEIVVDGKTWGIEVDESGKLLEKELEEGDDDAEDEDDADDAKPAGVKEKAKEEGKGDDDAKADAKGEDGDEDNSEEGEEHVKLEQLPPAVKKALQNEAGEGKIGEIEKETEGGRTVYEAEVTADGKTWEITFGTDGKVLEKELDDEEEGDEDEGENDDH